MDNSTVFIDPRTKIFLLVVINIMLFNTANGYFIIYLKFIIGFLPFILLLTSRRVRISVFYIIFYLLSHFISLYVLKNTTGFLDMFLGFFSSIGTKFAPGGMMGVYFFCSTRVNEFIAAMDKMHIPSTVTIPMSVMFRFFYTVKEEADSISDAMRMRKIGFKNFVSKPIEVLEYRIVPLMISVVNIADELSASAITRCLNMNNGRTNISSIGFGIFDITLFIFSSIMILIYFLDLGGVI